MRRKHLKNKAGLVPFHFSCKKFNYLLDKKLPLWYSGFAMKKIDTDNEKYFRPKFAKFTRTYLDNQGNATGDEEEVECELPFPEWGFNELSNFKDMVASELNVPANVLVASRTNAGLLRVSYKGDENGNLADSPTYQWNVYFLLRYPITDKEVEDALKGAKGDWVAEAVDLVEHNGEETYQDTPEDYSDIRCNSIVELENEAAADYDAEVVDICTDKCESGVVLLTLKNDESPLVSRKAYYRLMGLAKTKDIDVLLSQQK